MNIVSMIFSGLIVLQLISMNMAFSAYSRDVMNKFEEKRLKVAVNYAVDAATKEMKEDSANLSQDYESISKISVDPMVAMDTFATVMLKNYNVPLNSINRQQFYLDYCPVLAVATYDGYYVAGREKINNAGVENMLFSPKLPYDYIHTEDDGTKSLYSVNLSLTSALKVAPNGEVFKADNLPISRKEQSDLINTKMSDVLNEYLMQYASKQPRGQIFIPSELTTIHSTNPIRNTTVFAYIDNFDLAGYGMDLQSFGIGGAEIKQKKVVVGFYINVGGVQEKYYAYSDRLPAGTIPVESFDSQEDAAKSGYYYYVE